MGCKCKAEITIPSDERCNEMIKEFEIWLGCSYSDKEKTRLINEIKTNPNDFWYIKNNELVQDSSPIFLNKD